MMVRLVVLVFIAWRLAHLTCHAFPMHNIGHQKDVTSQTDRREHLLCWVVHIMTHSKCTTGEERGEPSDIKSSSKSLNIAELSGQQTSAQGVQSKASKCGSSAQSEQHAKEIASELGLVVVKAFQEFHDHFLMCHSNGNLNSSESCSRKILHIHREHAALKSRDANTFSLIQDRKRRHMSVHHEVLYFSQEFAFRRHSRSFLRDSVEGSIPRDEEKAKRKRHIREDVSRFDQIHTSVHLLLTFVSSKLINNVYNKAERPAVCNDVLKGDEKYFDIKMFNLSQCFHRCSTRGQNVSQVLACCYQYYHILNASLVESTLERGLSSSAFFTLLNKQSLYLAYLFDKTDTYYVPKRNTKSFTIPTHIRAVISSDLKKEHCNEAINGLPELYSKLFATHKEKAALKTIICHLMKILLCPLLYAEARDRMGQLSRDLPVSRNSLRDKSSRGPNVFSDNHVAIREFSDLSETSLDDERGSRIERTWGADDDGSSVAMFNDPAFSHQWHLLNRVTPSMDVNVTGIWRHNYTGQGVTVAVVDDGLEWRNPDLKANHNYHGSWDLNDDDPDPTPSTKKMANHHGTRCAGEIAAVANNKVCGVGVAYGSQISGLRVLDGIMTDSLEAEAFNKKMDVNDIYSCSWGPDDDGRTVDGPHLMAAKAMKHGVDFGRDGYGSIYVVASGNGGSQKDNCNFDGYANSIYTVTIGAVDENGGMPYYAEECASMLGVTFSSGLRNQRDIVTTDWTLMNSQGCTDSHTGTSAAAPLAAGMVALMLGARPCLSWRDVQHVVILTARKVDVDLAHWGRNGAGLWHSHKHGFGLLDAWRLVNAARIWRPVAWMTSFSYTGQPKTSAIPKGARSPLVLTHAVAAEDVRGYGLATLESVQVTVWLDHPCRGKLGVRLRSPSGTTSIIAAPRPKDNSSAGFQGWTFTTVRNWGESPVGNWTLVVIDTDVNKYGQGKLTKWRLTLFGSPMTPTEFQERRRLVESAMSGQFLSPNLTQTCGPPPEYKEQPAFMSEKTLKILTLASAFCLVMALYETLEYMFCYGDEKKEKAREMKLARRALQQTGLATANANGCATADPSLSPNPALASDGDGANISLLSRGNFSGATTGNEVDDDEEEEDDVFEAPETQGLLSHSRDASAGNATFIASHLQQSNGRIPPRVFSDELLSEGETIPMSTFSVSKSENTNCADAKSESQ